MACGGPGRWVDIGWAGFVGLNLAAMRLLPAWQTVPFLAIWVSLTVIYGFRLRRLQPTILTLVAVTLATGGIIGVQVLKGQQDADCLTEVPLIALMFLGMVWHGQQRLVTVRERLTAMEEVQRVTEENLRLLEQQRWFLQDASHELGPRSPWRSATSSLSSGRSPATRLPRTPGWLPRARRGYAGSRTGCCC